MDALIDKAIAAALSLTGGQVEALVLELEDSEVPVKITRLGSQPAPQQVRDLCDAWRDVPTLDGPGLAAVIRSAARTVKVIGEREKVELLCTGPGTEKIRRTHQGLLEVIRGAQAKLWVVSYVFGAGVDEIVDALQERAQAGTDVRVLIDHRIDRIKRTLTRFSASAPACELFIWPDVKRKITQGKFANLHAKCAVADSRKTFVSSANLTDWAMTHNLEVGYLVTGGKTPGLLNDYLDELVSEEIIVNSKKLKG